MAICQHGLFSSAHTLATAVLKRSSFTLASQGDCHTVWLRRAWMRQSLRMARGTCCWPTSAKRTDRRSSPCRQRSSTATGAIRALARLHAAWWNDNRLGRGIGTGWNDDRISELCNDTEQVVRSFLAFLGDALSPRRRTIYEQLLALQPELRHRQMARPLTVTHGDAHWGNFLFPRDARIDTAALVDWELWEVAPAANDLAYHIALWSWPERRHRLELPLLRTYHSELARWGVNDYAWETCVQDYRLFVAKLPLGVAWMWHRHLAPLVWWDNLERALLAFEDLDCAQLLE